MAMTVGALLGALAGLPEDRLVVMASDAEGNGYSPLDDLTKEAAYVPSSTWAGDILDEDEDEFDGSEMPAVVLWPAN